MFPCLGSSKICERLAINCLAPAVCKHRARLDGILSSALLAVDPRAHCISDHGHCARPSNIVVSIVRSNKEKLLLISILAGSSLQRRHSEKWLQYQPRYFRAARVAIAWFRLLESVRLNT